MFGLRASSKHSHHLKDCCRLPPQIRFFTFCFDYRSHFSTHDPKPHSQSQPLQLLHGCSSTTFRTNCHVFGLRASSKHPHHLKDCCRLPPQLRFSPYILTTGLTSLHMTPSPTANRNHYSCSTGVHRRHAGPTAMCLALELAQSTLTTSKTAADYHPSYDFHLTF